MQSLDEKSISPIAYLSKQYQYNRKEKYKTFHRDILSKLAPLIQKWLFEAKLNPAKKFSLSLPQKKVLFSILKKNCRSFLRCDFFDQKDYSLQHYLDSFYFEFQRMSQKSLLTSMDLQAFLLFSGYFLPSTIYKEMAGFLGIERHYLLALVSRLRRIVSLKMAGYFMAPYHSFVVRLIELKIYQKQSNMKIRKPQYELILITRLKQSQRRVFRRVKSFFPRISLLQLLKVLRRPALKLWLGLWKCKLAFFGLFE